MEIERMKHLAELLFWPLADLVLGLAWIFIALVVLGVIAGIIGSLKDGDE